MRIETASQGWIRLLIVVLVSFQLSAVPATVTAGELMDKIRKKTKQLSAQARTSAQRASENLRRDYESWERRNGPKIKKQIQDYSREVGRAVDESCQKTQEYWETEGKYEAQEIAQRASKEVSRAWHEYSPRAARELQNAYEQCSPVVVETCSEAYRRWGEDAGANLSEIYRKYDDRVGDRLWEDLGRYSSSARKRILDSYRRWGPEVGRSLQDFYDTHGPTIGSKLQDAYETYGPMVGAEIRSAYERWGPEVGAGLQSAYMTYGTAIGESLHEAYLRFDHSVGEELRSEYLPRICAYAADEAHQQMALEAAGNVIHIFRHPGSLVYPSLSKLANTPIKTAHGETTVNESVSAWIRKEAPFLVGTDIEQDPAKVLTYCILFGDKEMIFNDLKLIPNGDGGAMSCRDKLVEVCLQGADADKKIEVLDLMDTMEATAAADSDPAAFAESAIRITQTLDRYNARI